MKKNDEGFNNQDTQELNKTAEMPVSEEGKVEEIPNDKTDEVENNGKTPKYASPETAKKRIKKAYAKTDKYCNEDILEESIGLLYATCAAQNIVPTRDGFAKVCKNQEMGEFVLSMKKDPFRPSHKVPITIGATAAALLLVCGIAYGVIASQSTEDTTENQQTEVAAIDASTEEGEVSVTVECPGWNKDTSTPIVLVL